jgi:hypothetical protein
LSGHTGNQGHGDVAAWVHRRSIGGLRGLLAQLGNAAKSIGEIMEIRTFQIIVAQVLFVFSSSPSAAVSAMHRLHVLALYTQSCASESHPFRLERSWTEVLRVFLFTVMTCCRASSVPCRGTQSRSSRSGCSSLVSPTGTRQRSPPLSMALRQLAPF